MMPHFKLEAMLEEFCDEILAEGQAIAEDDANHWKVLDAQHRMDQQKKSYSQTTSCQPPRVDTKIRHRSLFTEGLAG